MLSQHPVLCSDGLIARNSSNVLRTTLEDSCISCEPGYYSDNGLVCYVCPEGYFCPKPGTNPFDFPCIRGHYCPAGSHDPLPCPEGSYNNQERSTSISDCIPCLENSYSEMKGW